MVDMLEKGGGPIAHDCCGEVNEILHANVHDALKGKVGISFGLVLHNIEIRGQEGQHI